MIGVLGMALVAWQCLMATAVALTRMLILLVVASGYVDVGERELGEYSARSCVATRAATANSARLFVRCALCRLP